MNDSPSTPPYGNSDIIEERQDNSVNDDSASTSHNGITYQLGTSPVESGITNLHVHVHVHQSILIPMWEKANKLLKLEHGAKFRPECIVCSIFLIPCSTFVTSKSSGPKIRSHTLVASEKSDRLALF